MRLTTSLQTLEEGVTICGGSPHRRAPRDDGATVVSPLEMHLDTKTVLGFSQ